MHIYLSRYRMMEIRTHDHYRTLRTLAYQLLSIAGINTAKKCAI